MTLNEQEDDLMIAFQKGDVQKLEELYNRLKEPLYSFIYRYTRDEQLSIDIVQDSFVKLQRYKHQYNPDKGKVRSYLFQIAYSLMVSKINRQKKWYNLLPFLSPIPKDGINHTDRMTIRDAVANLPDMHRAVVLLFYYHDMSQEEIALILRIPKGTVKSRLHSAIQRLKDGLGEFNNETGSF